jgi:hypothetical protein
MEREIINIDSNEIFYSLTDASGFADPEVFLYSEAGYEMIFTHSSGGLVLKHEFVDANTSDYREVYEIAVDKALCGCIVQILPVLNEHDPLRVSIFAGAKKRKCPDLRINGVYAEVKTPNDILHARKINKNIKAAHEQADYVIINLRSEFSAERLKAIAKGRFLSHLALVLLEFKMCGVYYTFKRTDFI